MAAGQELQNAFACVLRCCDVALEQRVHQLIGTPRLAQSFENEESSLVHAVIAVGVELEHDPLILDARESQSRVTLIVRTHAISSCKRSSLVNSSGAS